MTTIPTDYFPQKIDDFYGPARDVAKRVANSAALCKQSGAPAAHLFVGPSGSGKTSLALFAFDEFAVVKWNRSEIFGVDISVDRVREMAFDMRLSNVFGGFRGYLLDEVDRCTSDARNRLLQILGDRIQPRSTVILATSNLSLEEIDAMEKCKDARGRFSSRWQVHQVDAPTAEDCIPMARMWVPEDAASDICITSATLPDGRRGGINVRALTKDLTSYLQK